MNPLTCSDFEFDVYINLKERRKSEETYIKQNKIEMERKKKEREYIDNLLKFNPSSIIQQIDIDKKDFNNLEKLGGRYFNLN